jgi:peptidoglycan hydrolase-like amidase
VLVLAGVLVALGAPPAAAAPPGGPAPPGGWVAGRVRFEPLDAAATGLTADGGPGHRGALEMGPGGSLIVDIPVDAYVLGIQEVPLTWPAAALEAQAIAARTFALHTAAAARARKGRAATEPDICATESCQVYTGLVSEQRPGGPAWAAAVAGTSGKVLLHKGAPLLAKYSSSNGGRSISGGRPYLPSVNDPDDAASPLHRWTQPLSLAALTSAFELPGPATGATRSGATVTISWAKAAAPTPPKPGPEPGPLAAPPTTSAPQHDPMAGLIPGETTTTSTTKPPAAAAAAAPAAPAGEKGERRIAVADFRARVNGALPKGGLPRTLPSDQFNLAAGDGVAIAEGRGFGHAIGMSQWGAFGKAQKGMSADAILASYYGGTRPKPAPAGLPTTLRVGVGDVANPEVRAVPVGAATASGVFRVVADGVPLATVATGVWKVRPGPRGGTLRVVPPPEQAGAVALDQVVAGRTSADPAAPVAVAFRLSQPALVSVAGAPAQPLAAGDHRVEAAAGPGVAAVTVAADAGGGRTAAVEAPVAAVAPPPTGAPPSLPLADPAMGPLVEDPNAFGPLVAAPVRAGTGGATPRWPAALAVVLLGAVVWSLRRLRSARKQHKRARAPKPGPQPPGPEAAPEPAAPGVMQEATAPVG